MSVLQQGMLVSQQSKHLSKYLYYYGTGDTIFTFVLRDIILCF